MTASQPLRPAVSNDQPPPALPVVLRSEELLQGRREILIIHSQEVYHLRLTRSGKLILTK
jgi:hemin uptake protein HemP